MTRCLDEAKLQSYFDGELSIELMESVTSHLASCATCAAAARELEEESTLVMNALAIVVSTPVKSRITTSAGPSRTTKPDTCRLSVVSITFVAKP